MPAAAVLGSLPQGGHRSTIISNRKRGSDVCRRRIGRFRGGGDLRASAKVDFRLIPDQHPDDILKKLRAHLDAEGFSDVKITDLGGDPPARADPDDPFIQLVAQTSEEVYEVPMQLVPLVGGSGPSYPFVHDLKLPVATAGMGYPDTRAHAPNENIRIDLYLKHARHMARLIKEFAK